MEIPQNCATPIGISKAKNETHGNSTWIFLDHAWKFLFFFYWPLEFPHSIFLITSGYSISSTPSLLFGFFLEQPISKFCQVYRPYKMSSLPWTTLPLLTLHCTTFHFTLNHCYAVCQRCFYIKTFPTWLLKKKCIISSIYLDFWKPSS